MFPNNGDFNGIDGDIASFWSFVMEHFTPSERWYFVRLIHLHEAENAVWLQVP